MSVRRVISTARDEFAVALDCTKNGCETPHSDDGWVSPFTAPTLADLLERYGDDPRINGHAVSIVWRTVPPFTSYSEDADNPSTATPSEET